MLYIPEQESKPVASAPETELEEVKFNSVIASMGRIKK